MLVMHGEPGVGKTALLDHLADHASACRVVRAAGVESEMELAFAGLHQLCAPMVERLDVLPAPQQDALRTAFGMSAGPAPDRFMLGLAVLNLLSGVAEAQPLLCLVDDEQWVDRASAQVLAFVARRLGAESLGLVFATRVLTKDLVGLPELVVEGLRETDARQLLDSVLPGPIDASVRDQIIAETRGNPLALLELPRGVAPAELAGGFGLPGALPLVGSIEESFERRIAALPATTRQLLVLAAADTTADTGLVWRAAARLGIDGTAAAPAAEAGLAVFGTRMRFRHPLVRSAAYRSATTRERQEAHRALAGVTDPLLGSDRRAWHRAQALSGPDEDVAAELQRSAGRARARGGLAAAAAFLERAATLTLDPAQRAGRALAAAEAQTHAGALDAARDLVDMAEAGPLSDSQEASADLIRARLAFVSSHGGEATTRLLKAARRLESIDADLSRATYLDALSAGIFAGRLAGPASSVRHVARAAAAMVPGETLRAPDLLLHGLATAYNDGYSAGLPMLRQALADFGVDMSVEEELHWLWLASITALRIWDDDAWERLSARHIQLARDAGALSELPLALTSRAYVLLFTGELPAAASLTHEAQTVKDATGSDLAPYGALGVAAFRGDEATALALIDATREDVTRSGEGVGITIAEWANAVLHNGLGRYPDAMAAAQRSTAYDEDPGSHIWGAVELIEAATRTGATEVAANAYRRLSEMTTASASAWARGLQARCHALLVDDETAEHLYLESIEHLGRTRLRVDLARAHLLYGEWLRRERRRSDAREQLRIAHTIFETMGMVAFAQRAGRELRVTGESARKRALLPPEQDLTPQEAEIARLARDGLSNPEIGTRLFISPHTVQYHLRKVFMKLGITSRSQLDRALPPFDARAGGSTTSATPSK